MWRSMLTIFIVSVLLVILTPQVKANPVNMSSTEAPAESKTSSILDAVSTTTSQPKCTFNIQPCGWGVFSKNRKKVDYFIKNTCVCASSQKCLLDGEDLSLGAYVYRCKERSTA